ncbi:hypothetical protein Pla22_10750 [Rubripirellula amarantea]|uniref:Anaphase-promoting complex, cyclosome, subunit 3 n=1 Tax=Rubripirellula amarantea TaxID=2527999 RepID=A0A5C5WRK3_9BACT|nr:hypothetical protein [Rubripirellula amarantea]TWT53446.1 hypothetical protein Pla22_10750 [Rubripirellula amarantea]
MMITTAMTFRFTIATFIAFCLCSADLLAEVGSPVRRVSNDRDQDVLDALLQQQRFDDATQLCNWNIGRYQPPQEEYAKWAIAICNVRIAQSVSLGNDASADVEESAAIVSELIRRYPDQPRRLFLDQAILQAEVMATQSDVARTALTLHDLAQVERTMVRLTRINSDLIELAAKAGDSITQIESLRDPDNDAMVGDLRRLEQELLVSSVSMAMLQTELFPPDGDDFVAAAAKAEAVAEQTLLKLPASSQAAHETRRIKADAILRRGDADQAKQELRKLLAEMKSPWPPAIVALIVRTALATGQTDTAAKQLDDYFGAAVATSSATANQHRSSIAMDLARLEWLLKTDQLDQAADWIEAIERRNGKYARRRAEAIAMHLAPDQSSTRSGNGLMATRGYALLRRGETLEAARVLAAAARQESDLASSAKLAIASAAAFESADQRDAASEVLLSTARLHAREPEIAGIHLQGLMLASDTDLGIAKLEASLRWHLDTWPQDATTKPVRDWLLKLLTQSDRKLDAAVASSQFSEYESDEPLRIRCIDLWRSVFHDSSLPDLDQLSQVAAQAFDASSAAPLDPSSFAASVHREIAVRFLQRRELTSLPPASDQEPEWIEACLELRRKPGSTNELPLDWNDSHLAEKDFVWRWIRDGDLEPRMRPIIAKRLNSLTNAIMPPLDRAKLMIWQGQVAAAIELLQRTLANNDDATMLADAAEILGQSASDSTLAVTQSVQWWDKLAAGSPKNSHQWHRAKLSAIKLLAHSGQTSEAEKRARYLLLTTPGLSASQRQEYQAWQTTKD